LAGGDVLTGEVQQKVAGRWRVVLTAGGIPVDDRRRASAGEPRPGTPGAALDDYLAEVLSRYARGWHG
jgi:hypothetical protein